MSVIDDVRSRLDIVELVGNRVRLQRSGSSMKANCPFHEERTPSFYVFPDRQTWRCFGACAEGGDVFNFIMKAERVEFGEALRMLAQQAGVTLRSGDGRDQGQRDQIEAMHEKAVEFYQRQLRSDEGEPVRRYIEDRGINQLSSDLFKLGYSPRRGSPLTDLLSKDGHTPDQLVRAGLSRKDDTGRAYDLFRGRLMIPITDYSGKVVGFGSRALDPDDRIKYMNTPQTPLFDKSRILYALDRAKESARTQGLVIVEGYMDAIAAHQHGHVNVAASMGTALTEQQVALVRRVSSNVIMALDGDNAGRNATLRSLEGSWGVFQRRAAPRGDESVMQGNTALDLRVAELPEGQDPDDLLRESPGKWPEFIASAKALDDYLWETLSLREDVSTADGRAWAARIMLRFICQIPDRMDREMALDKLATRSRVRREALDAALSEVQEEQRRQQAQQRQRQQRQEREEENRRVAEERRHRREREEAERKRDDGAETGLPATPSPATPSPETPATTTPSPETTAPKSPPAAGRAEPPPEEPPVADEYLGAGASAPYDPGEAYWPDEDGYPVDEEVYPEDDFRPSEAGAAPPPDGDAYDTGSEQLRRDRLHRRLRGDNEREECLIALLIQHHALVRSEPEIRPEWITSSEMRELFSLVYEAGPERAAASDDLPEVLRSRLEELGTVDLRMDSYRQPAKAWGQIRLFLHRQYLKTQLTETALALDLDDADGPLAQSVRARTRELRAVERERVAT